MVAFEFGPFLLDPAKRSLLRDGAPLSVTPKAFDILLLLIEQRDRVLSKDELLRTMWPETFVEEANLTQHVFMLRKVLNGDGDGPDYIATVPRRGYRFVSKVIERSETQPEPRPSVKSPAGSSSRWRTWFPLGCVALGAVILVLLALRSVPVGREPGILAVTAFPGLERFPSISPDGNFVVFSWTGTNPEGVPDLWIKAVDSNDLRRLTDTPFAEAVPAWSPDGREIAFVRGGHGVFIVSALGGPERKVADSGTMVGWTPDSRVLLVRDHADNKPYGIFRIDLSTGQRRQVTQAPDGIGDFSFDVSPDGKTLAFVRYGRPGVSDVYTATLDGSDARRRTNWNASISRVAWTADGRDIVFAVNEQTGLDQSLFRVSAASETVERGVRALHISGANPSMSRPGSGRAARIAFTSSRIDVGVRLLDLAVPRPGDVLGGFNLASNSTRVDVPGSFSRDGERVAFLSDRTGSAEAWVARRDGSGLQQATTLHATELLIGAWSPDDRRLVIDAAIDGNSDVYVVSLDGAPPVRLTAEPGFDGLTEWSADGRWIYFSSDRSGRLEVWKAPAAGGQAMQVTRTGGGQPKEGPDGRTILYLDRLPMGSGFSGTSRLMQVPVNGGEETPLLESIRFGLWAVTQTGIVFLTTTPSADAMNFYGFSDRKVKHLGALPFRVSRVAGLGWLVASRDGRSVMVSATDLWESDIMVADGVK